MDSKGQFKTKNILYGCAVNDADYVVHKFLGKVCPFYDRWYSIIRRCYSGRTDNRDKFYAHVVVCDEWLTFSNFKKWMEKQDWKGKQIDKDLLGNGNIYSPETCCFINRQLNQYLIGKKSANRDLPTGVYRTGKKFHARGGRVHGKEVYLGIFYTSEEARISVCKYRILQLENHKKDHADERVRCAIDRMICDFKIEIKNLETILRDSKPIKVEVPR